MHGISSFSKQTFIEHCTKFRETNARLYQRHDNGLELLQGLCWQARLAYGRHCLLGQLKDEAENGGILNDKGLFTKSALIKRVTDIQQEQCDKHGFRDTGYSQVTDKPMKVVMAYLTYHAAKSLLNNDLA